MRDKKLILECSPCNNDFTDKSMQKFSDAQTKGPVVCDNLSKCSEKGIQCYRTAAKQMAAFVIDRINDGEAFSSAIQAEKRDYLKDAPDGNFWVKRDGKWKTTKGKENVIDDIVDFVKVILDLSPEKEHGKAPEIDLEDVTENSVSDLKEIHREIGVLLKE